MAAGDLTLPRPLTCMLVSISKTCDVLGVCTKTLYRWERRGYILPNRTPGNHRRYDYDALVEFRESCVYDSRPEVKTGVAAVYARVSNQKQKEDLVRQVDFLSERARRDRFRVRVYSDIGSGLNDARPRLLKMLKDGLSCQFDRVYITFLDRLARFSTRPLVEVLKAAGVDVVAVHVPEDTSYEQALVAALIAIVTSFAGKVHRRRPFRARCRDGRHHGLRCQAPGGHRERWPID